jgi:hypothetical protein
MYWFVFEHIHDVAKQGVLLNSQYALLDVIRQCSQRCDRLLCAGHYPENVILLGGQQQQKTPVYHLPVR